MTEQEKIDQFNRDVEGVLKGNAPEAGSDPQRLDAARQLAAADFSAHSRARTTTRTRLLARANRELPVQNKRKEMNTRFSNVLRTLAFGAFLLMMVFGLGWVLSNTTPQVGVGLEGTATSEPVIVPEEPAIAFPRKGATEDLMESLMMGRLILVDRCLRIEDSESDTSLLVVWPYDFNWQITNGIVEVLDGTGQVVARVGEGVSMGGGELDSLAGMGIDNPIQAQIPDSCPGPYWFVGSGVQMTELDNQVFRSEANHLEVTVPDGWAAYEGQEYIANPFTGVVAFNSWGEQGFWAPEVVTQQSDEVTTYSYGVEDVLPQIPQDGVYIVLVWQSGGPPPEEGSFVEYVENDLSGLWRPLDCRRSGGRYLDFYKFERILRLEIYCGPQASDTTVEAANSLLSSWRFDNSQSELSNPQPPTPLTLDSDSETIRQRMLQSTSLWQSLWADALVTTESKGEKHVEREQVWVNLPDQSRWLSGLEGTQPSLLQITSGADMVLITAEGDRFESTTTRPQIADLETLIFPGDFARGAGTFKVVREETAAARPALVVEWHNPEDRVEHRLWLDTETGIILRWQNLFPEPPDGSGKSEPSEIQIVKITYNPSFSDELFSLNQALDLEFTEGLSGIPSPLTLNSTSEEIRQRILLSHTFWQALWADAQITDYVSGTPAIQRVQVWVNQPAQARVLSGKADGTPATLWISDGQLTRTGEDLSGYGLENFVPPMTESDTVYPHPMTGIMPTPLSNLLFPSGLAQRGGTYRPIAMDTVAGRETLVVEWNRPDGPLTDRFWVDTVTGVILHQQNYGKGGDGALTAEYVINSIQYDLTFPTETFNRLASFPPVFASGPEDIFTEVATPVPEGEPDTSLASGEIYIGLENYSSYFGIKHLGHFPASCLISGEPCPAVEFFENVPTGLQFPIGWSPDYQQAIFPVSEFEEQMWRFERDTQTWTLLGLPYFTSNVVWSPDGQRIVGETLMGAGQKSNPLMILNTNVADWREIMADLPGVKYAISWLDETRILIWNNLDGITSEEDTTVYDEFQIYNTTNEDIEVVTGVEWDYFSEFLVFRVSSDKTQLIYALSPRNSNSSTVTRINLNDLSQTSFNLPISIWDLSWSPDGEWLALTVYAGSTCELHLAHPDGSDLHRVLEWPGTCFVEWSPDGQYLLVPALAQTPTIPRLYVINVATGESRLVELPDVGVEFEWPVVSWVP